MMSAAVGSTVRGADVRAPSMGGVPTTVSTAAVMGTRSPAPSECRTGREGEHKRRRSKQRNQQSCWRDSSHFSCPTVSQTAGWRQIEGRSDRKRKSSEMKRVEPQKAKGSRADCKARLTVSCIADGRKEGSLADDYLRTVKPLCSSAVESAPAHTSKSAASWIQDFVALLQYWRSPLEIVNSMVCFS